LMARPASAAREPEIVVHIRGGDTAGRCGMVETVEKRGTRSPRHLHLREDETLYVVEGFLSLWVAGEWVEAPASTAHFLPRGVEHALLAETTTARVLSFFAPAGFEGFYGEMAAAGPYDIERLVTTAARYGCEIAGPTPERPRLDPAASRPRRLPRRGPSRS